jgi:hypothetical protein
MMTQKDIKKLKSNDIITHKTDDSYIAICVDGKKIGTILEKKQMIKNPSKKMIKETIKKYKKEIKSETGKKVKFVEIDKQKKWTLYRFELIEEIEKA